MKLEQATSKNTKVGDKCYIEVEVIHIKDIADDNFPIKTNSHTFTKLGKLNANMLSPQLYHIIQEEIPTLGEGVEMEVSDNLENWFVFNIIAKNDDYFMDTDLYKWKYARPIELTLEQKYENALKENEELKQKLSKM